jgi:hypothetical protein
MQCSCALLYASYSRFTSVLGYQGHFMRASRGLISAPFIRRKTRNQSTPTNLSMKSRSRHPLLGAGNCSSPFGCSLRCSLRRLLIRPRVANPPRRAISRRRSQLNLVARARPPSSPAHAGQTNSVSGCLSQCIGQFSLWVKPPILRGERRQKAKHHKLCNSQIGGNSVQSFSLCPVFTHPLS